MESLLKGMIMNKLHFTGGCAMKLHVDASNQKTMGRYNRRLYCVSRHLHVNFYIDLMHSGFLKDTLLQQAKDSADSPKTLTAESMSLLSRGCKSVHHFYEIALSEYNLQKTIFWQTLLQVHKIDRDKPVSKTSVKNIISYLHPAWTAGQVRQKCWHSAPECIYHPYWIALMK
jgi:hypothetical protein